MPNPVKWITNVGKSISYSFVDEMKELNPALNSFKEDNGDFVKSIKSTVSIKSIKDSAKNLSGNEYFQIAKDTLNNLKSDIKTGNLYNREREKQAENQFASKMLGFDDSDFGFGFDDDGDMNFNFDEDVTESIDQSTKSTNDMVDLVGKKTSLAISNAVVGSSEYMAKTTRKNTKILFDQNNILFSKLHSDLGTVNQNIGSILEFNKEATTTHYNNSATYYSNMTSKMEETTSMLKEMLEMQKEYYGKKNDFNGIYGTNERSYSGISNKGVINLEAFFKNVKGNVKDKLSMLDMLGSMVTDNGMGGMISASPGKLLTQGIAKILTPKMLKESMKDFNETLSGVLANAILKINDEAGDFSFKQIIASLFKTDESLKTSINTSGYKKDAIPFDGVTKKAITEVIPTYLAKILSAVSNQTETRYDYEKGKFVSMDEIKREYQNIIKNNSKMASWNMSNSMMDLANNTIKFDDNEKGNFITKKQFQKDLEAFFEYQYKNAKVFNGRKENIDAAKYGMKGGQKSEISAKLIKQMWNALPNKERMKLAGEILDQRQMQNTNMRDIESNSNSSIVNLFNGSGATNTGNAFKSRKASSDSPYANSSKYSGAIIDILGDIRKEVSYIRSYGVGEKNRFSNSFKGKRSKKKSKTTNNYNRTVSFENYNPYDDINVNDFDEEENYGSIDITYMNENLVDANGKKLPPLEKKDNETQEEFEERVRERFDQIKSGKKKNKGIFGKIADATSGNKLVKSIAGGIDKILEKPTQFLTTVIRKADETVFDLVFGKAGDKENKGILYEMKVGIRKTFTNIGDWLQKNVLDPIKDKFTAKNIKEMGRKFFGFFGIDIDKTVKSVREKLFGVKGEDGKRIDGKKGIFGQFIDDTKDSFKKAFGWVKGTFKEAAEWAGFKGTLNEKGKTKQKKKNMAQDVMRQAMKNEDKRAAQRAHEKDKEKKEEDKRNKTGEEILGQAAAGLRRVPKTGVYALSEGEAVIPPDHDPSKIRRRYANEARAIDRYKKHGGISMFGEGTEGPSDNKDKKEKKSNYDRAKEIYDSIKFEYDDYEEGQAPLGMEIMKQLSNLLKFGKAFVGDVSDKVMTQEDANNKVKEDVTNIFGKVMNLAPEVKSALPNMTAGAVIGSGVSLISGMIGGPLLGAAVGAASGLVIKSKTVQDLLFGRTDKDGNYKAGLIPKNVSDTIKKYVPSMAKGSTLGMITSLIPFVPGGPMAGILLGSAAGVVAKNEKIYNALFGEDSILPDFPNRIKKALPKMGAGAAVGLVAGPFGVATNILLGSAVGFAADSDKFKNVFFGEKDKYGKRVGGIYNTIVDTVSAPIKDMTQKFGDWFNKTIKQNLNDFFTPLKNSALHAVDTIKDFFKDKVNNKIVRPIEERLKSLLKPFAKLFGFAFNIGKNVVKNTVGLPFNVLGGIGRRMTRHQVKKGRAYDMTAAERNEYRRTHKLGIIGRDKASKMDQILEQMGSEDLQTAKDAIEFLRTGDRDNKKIINQNTKKIQNSINANIGKLPAKQQKDIIKYLNKGKYKQAIGYLDKINISDPSAKSALIKDIEASGKEIAKARYAMDYNKKGEYRTKAEDRLKALGFDTKSLNLRDMSRLLDTELADRGNSDAYEESKKAENFQNDILKDIQEIILQMKMLNKGLLGSDIDVESITTKNIDKKIKKAQEKAEKRNEQQEHIDRGEARTKFGRARQKVFGGIKGAVGHTFNRLGGWVFANNTTEDGNAVDRAAYRGVRAVETLGRGIINTPRRAKRAVTNWAGRKINKFKDRNDWLRRYMDGYFDDHDVDGQAAEGLYGVPYSGLYALSKGEYVIPRLAEGTENTHKRKSNAIILRIMMVGNKLRASLGMGKKSRRSKNNNEINYQEDNEKTTTSFYNGLPIKNRVDANGNVEPDTSDAETVNTLRERDEDRTRQKSIFDSIKSIPSKIGEVFGLGKKKEKKKDNLLSKILKAAGVAMLAAFFAPKIINFIKKTVVPFLEDTVVPVFKEKILPAIEDKLNDVKNGFMKGFLGDKYTGDNPEGIVGAFGEKIGEGTIALKNFLTDDVLPWIKDKAMPAVGNYLENKAPEILANAIKNLPKTVLTVGGIFGKTLNLVFGNKNNSGATNTVDTKNLKSGKKTSMTDEKGNKLTKEDIENKNYNSIYNSEGAKGKVNDDGTVTFTDQSNSLTSPLDTIGNAAFHQFVKGKPGKLNKAFQAVMKSNPIKVAKKIPLVKWPLKLFSGISKPLAKTMEWAGNLGNKASTKFAAKFLTDTVKTVGENGEEVTKVVTKTPKITKYISAILKKVQTIIDKLFSSKKSYKKIKELAEALKTSKVSAWISKFKDSVSKIFAKFTKNAASEATEDVVKKTAKKLNLVLTIATAVLDFIKGADQAESILGVTETSIVEEVVAGFVNAIVNAVPLLSLIPNIVSNIAKAIYNLFNDDLEERQKEADKEYQSYKDEGGTYTEEEYLKSKYSVTGKVGLWIEKKKSALFNKLFGKKKDPEGSKTHTSKNETEHGGSVGGSFAAGGTIPYSGLYALSKGEYIIPRLAEGTLNNSYNTLSLLSKVKDNNDILNTDSARESMQRLYDYASTGDDKFYKAASDNNSVLKLINLIGRSVFGPVYGIQKMQKNFTKNLNDELGDGDKVLEAFNLQLQDTNDFLSGKGSMKNYWNDRLDDNTSILGNMAKTITTIYKTLQFPMILSKSLFQYTSGQSSNDTDNVDAVSETTSTSGATTTTELNSATDSTTSMVGSTTSNTQATTKALSKTTSQTTYDRTQSGISTGVKLNPYGSVKQIKAQSRRKNMPNKYYVLVGKYGENNVRVERGANGRNIKKYKVRINGKWVDYSTLGSGSGLYVGGGSYDPEPIPEAVTAGNNRTKSPSFKYTEAPSINNTQYKPINTDVSNITPVSKNFVSQVTGNLSTERFNTSLDTTRQTVADTGCAPAVATMVINSLTGKSTIDMKTAMNDALPYKAQNSGVISEYFDDEFSKYGIATQYLNNDTSDPAKSSIVRAIKEKRPTILLGMDPTNKNKSSSPFGSSPHYVVADSISKDNQYIYIDDPESRKAKTKYSLRSVLPRVTVGITTSIGRSVKNASDKLTTYIGRATKNMVKPKSGDYISKYVHQFESGSKGPETIVHCGNDGGLSFGTYQMIWSYNGQAGSAQKFWATYFASKYGTPSSYNDLKDKWLQAIKDIGKDAFFAKEWEYALNSYYLGTTNTLKSKYGFDPDHYSRAMQECIWSWAIHRGNGGAVSEFGEVAAQFNNKPMEADETKLLNACYDVRYKHVSFPRYGNSASSERSTVLALVGQDPIDHTAPDGTAGSSVGTDDSTTTSNTSGGNKKSILDILLAPFDLLGSDYGLTGSNDDSSSSSGGTTQYNADGISGTVSSDKNIAEKQVKVVAQMNSVYGKLKYAQNNAKYPGSRNPDDGSGDCSSTVEWAYKKALGVEVGGYSGMGGQADASTTYTVDGGANGSTTNESNLQLGDILLYGTNAGSHAEMYFGNGKVLTHGNPNALGPTVANVGRRQDYWGARRLKEFKSNGTSTFSGDTSTAGSGSGLLGRGSFVSQLDPKYANKRFNISGDSIKQTIGDSGCAPAAATMVLNDIAGRASMMDNSKLALKYKGNNDGVTADYFSDIYSRNGLNTNYYSNSNQVASDLRKGKDVVLLGSDSKNTSKSNSPFGPNAHYVVASGMSKDGRNITIKDPEANKPKKYNTDKILSHTKLGIGYGSGLAKKLASKFRKYIGRGFGNYSGILYVGDSRTAMMRDCISEDGVSFIAKVGAGLDWLKSTAAAQVESKIANDPNLAVVFNFGVNDIYRPDQYVKFYQDFKNRHAKANLFFMSVNPVDNDPNCKDSDITLFNSKLQSFWGNNYLDVYSYLKSDGYKTTDGTHYDNATSKKIHEKVKSMLSGSTSTSSDSSSSSSTSGSESVLDKILGGMDNIAEKYGLVVNTGSSDSSSSSSTSGSTVGSDYPKYNLTDSQINEIATGVTGETGGDNLFESMQEASQMANLNEVTKKRQATGADMLNTLHSGWYASASFTRGVTDIAKEAVRKVFNEGKRTLPRYVTEHDTFPMDITNAKDRSAYQKGDPVSNRYGSNYKFYDFFGKNREGDISGYFDQDYATYQNDVPWSGTGSGLLNNYPKYKGRGGFNDVMTAFNNYTDQMASSMGLTDSNDSSDSVSDSTKSITKKSDSTSDMTKLMKSVIKLLAKVADNTSDISEIVSILSKLVDLQSTQMDNSETKQQWTSLKTDLANKLSSYNKTSTGSGELSNLMNSIESLAME